LRKFSASWLDAPGSAPHSESPRAKDKIVPTIPQFITSRSLIILVPFIGVVPSVISKLFFLGIKKSLGFEDPPFKVGRLHGDVWLVDLAWTAGMNLHEVVWNSGM
jgi:hypothetical protein